MTELRESEVLEFKERWTDRALEDLAAFSNHRGGSLLVGVTDCGEAIGFAGDDRELQRISNQVVDVLGLNPRIQHREVQGREVLEITVDPTVLPVSCRGRYLIRVGSVNREMSGEEIARRLLERSGQTWDALVSPWRIEDADPEEVDRFVQLARHRLPYLRAGETVGRILENLDLAREGRLTHGGVVLFARNPQRLFPLAQLRIARFAGGVISSERTFGGTLWAQLDGVLAYLREHLGVEYRVSPSGQGLESLQRTEVWPYPLEALREALLNSLMHRDYSSLGDIQVKLQEDCVSLWNPGGLYGGLSIENLRQASHPSRPRNPLIAQAFYLAGLVERWGTGTTRMLEACHTAGLPEPQFAEDAGGFRVTFVQAHQAETTQIKGLSDRQRLVVQHLREHERAQLGDLVQLFSGVSNKTVQREVQKLVELGVVRAVGEKKGRFYELVQ